MNVTKHISQHAENRVRNQERSVQNILEYSISGYDDDDDEDEDL